MRLLSLTLDERTSGGTLRFFHLVEPSKTYSFPGICEGHIQITN